MTGGAEVDAGKGGQLEQEAQVCLAAQAQLTQH